MRIVAATYMVAAAAIMQADQSYTIITESGSVVLQSAIPITGKIAASSSLTCHITSIAELRDVACRHMFMTWARSAIVILNYFVITSWFMGFVSPLSTMVVMSIYALMRLCGDEIAAFIGCDVRIKDIIIAVVFDADGRLYVTCRRGSAGQQNNQQSYVGFQLTDSHVAVMSRSYKVDDSDDKTACQYITIDSTQPNRSRLFAVTVVTSSVSLS